MKVSPRTWALSALALLLNLTCRSACADSASLGDGYSHFIGVNKFSNFEKASGTQAGETMLTSPVFQAPISWNQVVVSWNAVLPPGTSMKIEARAIYPDHATKFYTMSLWSEDPKLAPRESVQGQKDADGNVNCDTLILAKPCTKAQVRFTLVGTGSNSKPELKFAGLSFCNTDAKPVAPPSDKAAWGKEIAVIERSQNSYPDEKGWCSPTSLSMVLSHWSERLHRKDMALDVPEVAAAVFDRNFGTGNWPLNTAFAGHFDGMRAYVTRFSSLAEVEEWIAAGIPVIMSAHWDLLAPGRNETGSGHLVVCTGFTSDGDVVINDPGTNPKKDRVRHVYQRNRVINAWSKSHNTVYLVYPESAKIPRNTLGHWDGK